MKKKIGLYGGTFDPIHFGHINLALQLRELCALDEVILCPANLSPLKQDEIPLASAFHRLKMCETAILDIPNFSVTDIELQRGGVSYTVDTLSLLVKEFIDTDIFLLLSVEALASFHRWKDFEKIITMASPLIGYRSFFFEKMIGSLPNEVKEKFKNNFIKTKEMDISSTDIRQRLKKGLYCGHLLPAKVLDYINENGLYSNG